MWQWLLVGNSLVSVWFASDIQRFQDVLDGYLMPIP